MKEKMIKFLESGQNPLYFEEKQLIKEFIETFFNQYQPERSKREDYLEYSEHDISNFIRDYLLMNAKSTIKCNLEKLGKIVLEEINRCGALNIAVMQ